MNTKTATRLISAACVTVLVGACASSASTPAQVPAPVSVRVDTVLLVDTVTVAPRAVGAEAEAGRFDEMDLLNRQVLRRAAFLMTRNRNAEP